VSFFGGSVVRVADSNAEMPAGTTADTIGGRLGSAEREETWR
jgi:hypothetical protein